MSRLVVISPHCDDAVFSCGTLIATAALFMEVTVVNVYAADQERRAEDGPALALLGATPHYLNVPEGEDATAALADVFEPRTVAARAGAAKAPFLCPVGIRHADHKAVAAACKGHADWWYEELPYRVLWPEHVPYGLGAPDLELPASAVKMAAVRCYQSQLGGEPGEALWASERYHMS